MEFSKNFKSLQFSIVQGSLNPNTVELPNNDVKKPTYFPSDKGGTGIGRKQRFLGLRMKKTA